MNVPPFTYIDNDWEFAAAVARWRRADLVGIDTEFIRTRTFYPIAALYQVATAQEFAIVDPLRISAWHDFKALLEDARIVKVMHACSEDLEVFARHLSAVPVNLFDTQVAAGFLGPDFSPSYAALVKRYADIELTKHETRSDWLARPLREEQLHYAVADVAHLLPLYQAQHAELHSLGRTEWFAQEMANRVGFVQIDPEQCYRNVSRAWRCDGRALMRLQRLCAWRERYAREKDLPRGRVVKDAELVDLVCQNGIDRESLLRVVDPAAARRHGRDLLAVIAEADAVPEHEWPPALPQPMTPVENRIVKELKSVGSQRARELNIAEELLSRRRDLEACLRSMRCDGALPPHYRGWREPLVGAAFESLLESVRGS